MQVAQGKVLVRASALVQAAIGSCILLLLVPRMKLVYSAVDKDLRVETSYIILLIISTCVALHVKLYNNIDMRLYNCMIVHEYCFIVYFNSPHHLQVPPKVTGVSVSKAVKAGKPTLRVTWTALQNVANLSEYQVEYRRNGELNWDHRASTRPYSSSTLLPALLPGTEYNIRVRAVSAAGEGEWSEMQTEITYNSEFIQLHVQL